MRGLLQIGEIARLADVSVKTIRFYADEGLLPPAHVDNQTGYRYFERSQIELVTRILNLREAGVGVGDIRKLLLTEDPGDAAAIALLERQRGILTKEKERIESRLRIVDGLLASVRQGGLETISELRMIAIEPEFVHGRREIVRAGSGRVTELFEEAEREVAAVAARADRPPLLIIHSVGKADEQDVEVCIPITDDAVERLPSRLVSGETIACSVFYGGGYHQTEPLHEKIRSWLESAGLRASSSMRERYHRFGAGLEGYDLPKRVLASKARGYLTELQVGVSISQSE